MLINIKRMETGEQMPITFSEKLDIDKQYALLDNAVNVDIKGVLQKERDCFFFDGKLKATVGSECALCLTPVEKVLEIEMHDVFYQSLEDFGDKDAFEIISNVINFTEVALNSLLVEIPVKFICKKDCKGLCSICGADLNKEKCNCNHDFIDERFAVLKNLFKEV